MQSGPHKQYWPIPGLSSIACGLPQTLPPPAILQEPVDGGFAMVDVVVVVVLDVKHFVS